MTVTAIHLLYPDQSAIGIGSDVFEAARALLQSGSRMSIPKEDFTVLQIGIPVLVIAPLLEEQTICYDKWRFTIKI